MSQTTIWLEISHHAAFRVGGWAFVRREPDGALVGYAGGERRIEAERTALAALIAALKDLGPKPVRILTASAPIAAIPARIKAAQAGEDPPTDNLDLWAQAMTALGGGNVELARAPTGDRTTAFAAAWAELGRDRAKDKGPFTSAIPKPNLAKSGA
ncbi:ribonuclease H [Phenylobacterium sp. LjRoot219]|uniref:ribonuclease H n=1 Tax=Phenylobacterium sp. LjRoot219 TaxID=3342283 RepID=UPI003ED05E4F